MKQFESFTYQDHTLKTQFIETMNVTDGVTCDVYSHPETEERDLGIITIQPGYKTPLQRVLGGEETIEGYLAGAGKLIITHKDGTQSVHEVDETAFGFCHLVEVGELMQWQAAPDSELVVFEVCFPPYQEGRFENISE